MQAKPTLRAVGPGTSHLGVQLGNHNDTHRGGQHCTLNTLEVQQCAILLCPPAARVNRPTRLGPIRGGLLAGTSFWPRSNVVKRAEYWSHQVVDRSNMTPTTVDRATRKKLAARIAQHCKV